MFTNRLGRSQRVLALRLSGSPCLAVGNSGICFHQRWQITETICFLGRVQMRIGYVLLYLSPFN